MIHEIAESAQASQKQDSCNIYAIMKTMYPPGYHCNGFVVTHALALGKMILWWHISGANEPKSAQQTKQGAYAHLTSVRFEHSVCHGLLMATYIMLHA